MPLDRFQMGTVQSPSVLPTAGSKVWAPFREEPRILTLKKQGLNVCDHLHLLSFQNPWAVLGSSAHPGKSLIQTTARQSVCNWLQRRHKAGFRGMLLLTVRALPAAVRAQTDEGEQERDSESN